MGASVEPTQLAPGTISGSLAYADLGESALTIGRIEGELSIRGPLSDCHLVLGVLLGAEGICHQWSTEVRPGDVGVFPRDEEHASRYSGRSAYATLAVPLQTVRRRLEFWELETPRGFWRNPHMYRGPARQRASLLEAIQISEEMLARAGDTGVPHRTTQKITTRLTDAILSVLVAPQIPARPRRVAWQDPYRIVRRTDDYIHAFADRPVSLAELCDAAGISGRSPHRAFHSVLGIPPAAYALNWRLTRARQDLVSAHRGEACVTGIALSNGFSELGRFSQQFHRQFGELPREVLGRG